MSGQDLALLGASLCDSPFLKLSSLGRVSFSSRLCIGVLIAFC